MSQERPVSTDRAAKLASSLAGRTITSAMLTSLIQERRMTVARWRDGTLLWEPDDILQAIEQLERAEMLTL